MRICIVGTGYVGLVTAACFAERGHEVLCVDVDPVKVDAINAGRAPFHEPGLPELLARHAGGRLRATTDLLAAVTGCEMSFIAVGTPEKDGYIDLSDVERAAADIGAALRGHRGEHMVVVKSTVVPGTTAGVVRTALEQASGRRCGSGLGLAMNPEFLTEGSAVADFLQPDRLVLGSIDARGHDRLRELYRGFDATVPRLCTSTQTAEMIKYASNALLATLISYSNEIARLCTAVGGVDALEVMRGVHHSAYLTSRVGDDRVTAPIAAFLEAGCGFGGSCLPKDVTALIGHGAGLGLPMPLLRAVLEINRSQPQEMVRLADRSGLCLRDAPVSVLGIAFRPGTDDIRESPAFPLIRHLQAEGARVTAYDPVARPHDHQGLRGVTLADSLEAAVSAAEIVFLVTRWPQFQALPEVLRRSGRRPLVVDGRRLLEPAQVERYEGIGR